ncbi:MAG TPA: hypothetical protein VH165_33740 [Kofleriaceae bacterium]|nr:hypothetical protein [Kofleriaceae bacterium]
MRRAIWLLALAACGAPAMVGPFVKTITRQGPSLIVVSCEILIDRGDLYEGQCYTQTVPLPASPLPTSLLPASLLPASPLPASPPARAR